VLNSIQYRVKTRLQTGVFHLFDVVKSQSAGRKCEPVMGICLHQCLIFSPTLPPTKGNMRDVSGMALCPALEVVATDDWWALARSLQYEEAPEQLHQWPHPLEHLAEVDQDGHQHNGVGREVLQLEPIILQQREEEGGQHDTSPARAYVAKKTKSPSLMLASDAAPCFSLGTIPGAYHPISRRRRAGEPIVLNRKGGS
jgi:hypothetical protein